MDAADLDRMDAAEIATRLAAPAPERTAFLYAAADAGHAEAQVVVGQSLLDAGDAAAALGWFARAATQHHAMGLNMLGRCYDLGWGVGVDKVRAADCFRAAAELGLNWAQYNYATALALGAGVAEDKAAALDWLRKAAQQGNAKAINFIGSFHEDGWVVPRDLNAAARLYARAAAGSDFRGAFNHARMLGDAGRIEEAIGWLRKAGSWGNAAFVARARAFLAASPVAAFRVRGVQALEQGAAAC